MVHVLMESELYDMAFTLILKMWKGSNLKRLCLIIESVYLLKHATMAILNVSCYREMERAFIALSQKCCHARGGLIMEKWVFLSFTDAVHYIILFDGENMLSFIKIFCIC